ncbi:MULTISPECIES: class E sortase [unclassified Streptomyces]|uniref:class E sortase n=1 Tax=unclassified Streptomyces TaxID=2593676 RepID=UPI003450529D
MTRTRPRTRLAVAAVAAAAVVTLGCGPFPDGAAAPPTTRDPRSAPSVTPRDGAVTATAPAAPSPSPVPEARPRRAELDIPSIGVTDLPVLPYEGTSDDRAGTRIQDRGVAASPHGDRGGVGPGDVGNYLVTAHRLSAGGPLRLLPEVEEGDTVVVTADDAVYEYRIVDTRSTSFRSAASLAEQRAPVPGEPDERPTRAMITLSTCATPEDDAAGNHWRDALGNPEHRIDKIGVLVATRPPPDGS